MHFQFLSERLYSVLSLFVAMTVVTFNPVWAGESNDGGGKEHNRTAAVDGNGDKETGPEEVISVTEHSVEIDGETIEYTATAGTLLLQEEDGHEGVPKASVFYIAYRKKLGDDESKNERPVTFSFNGGPGSSSVWLHMGVLGPRRVLFGENGEPLPFPSQLVDNEYSILDKTDLVFIDPVSTGYSRAVKGEDPKQFHGVDKDVKSVGEFIRLYLTKNALWSAPKYLIGESYGTTRAAGLSKYLQQQYGMYLNGIMFVSVAFDFQTLRFNQGNDLPYLMFLPSYALTSHYHQRCHPDLQQLEVDEFINEVETFVADEYLPTLYLGAACSKDQRAMTIEKMEKFIGLKKSIIEDYELRIPMRVFAMELLRDQKKIVGRFDSRYLGSYPQNMKMSLFDDPSYTQVYGHFSGSFNAYVRDELEFENDFAYEILTGKVRPWDTAPFDGQYVNQGPALVDAMKMNPFMKIYVASGLYDLATPYYATDYTFNHLQLDKALRENITMKYYKSGHMMYLRKKDLIQQKEDLADFYDAAKK